MLQRINAMHEFIDLHETICQNHLRATKRGRQRSVMSASTTVIQRIILKGSRKIEIPGDQNAGTSSN